MERYLQDELEERRVHQCLGAGERLRHHARELRSAMVLAHGARRHCRVDVGRDCLAGALRRRADAFASTDAVAVTDMGERGAIENVMVRYTEALDDGEFERLCGPVALGSYTH